MFNRVKAYIIITGILNFTLSSLCIFAGATFKSPGYDIIMSILPLKAWGAGFAIVGALCAYALFSSSVAIARIGMSLGTMLLATWGISFLVSLITGAAQGPTGAIVWLSLAAYQVVIVATPNIKPIEEYIRREKDID